MKGMKYYGTDKVCKFTSNSEESNMENKYQLQMEEKEQKN